MARKSKKSPKVTVSKVEPVVDKNETEVVDLSEASSDVVTGSGTELLEEIFCPPQEIDEPVEDLAVAMTGPVAKPDVAVHTMQQETGVDLTEIIRCKISACDSDELAVAKQAETDGRTVIYE